MANRAAGGGAFSQGYDESSSARQEAAALRLLRNGPQQQVPVAPLHAGLSCIAARTIPPVRPSGSARLCRAYKYVPYGRVNQVMPYLLRRAAENQDIMKVWRDRGRAPFSTGMYYRFTVQRGWGKAG
jgi:hypothetical protein